MTKESTKNLYERPRVERVGALTTLIRGTASPNRFDQITPAACTPGDKKIDRNGRCSPL